MAQLTINYDERGNIKEPWGDGGNPAAKKPKMSLGFVPSTMSLYEFLERIPDEAAAVAFIEGVRWGDGVYCPRCTSESVYRVENGRPMSHRCRNCNRYFSVRINSLFTRTEIPLKKWLYAIYLLHTGRAGVSSHEFARLLGITQKSAWFMAHRIREGMYQDGAAYSEEVEVDETYVGGRLGRMHKNKREEAKLKPENGKIIVMGIRERRTGRVWTTIVPDTMKDTLQQIIGRQVEPGAAVYTDGHGAYDGLEYTFDYVHEAVYHSGPDKQYVIERKDENGNVMLDDDDNPILVHTNGIESFWALFKRGYRGVYFYMSPTHLHRYLNESAFRQATGKENNFGTIADTVRRMFGHRLSHKLLTGKT